MKLHAFNHTAPPGGETLGFIGLTRVNDLAQLSLFPDFRYMGSKQRLLPWIRDVLNTLDFETALDPFSGSNAVSYLMKAMDRRVISSDFLNCSATIGKALIENNKTHIENSTLKFLLSKPKQPLSFVEDNFSGIFYTPDDLRFLDRISSNLNHVSDIYLRSLAMTALIRACIKRQPRGVFTISGDLSKYNDGRRDLKLSIEEHFIEQVDIANQAVFSNNRKNASYCIDAFKVDNRGIDLVYLDPPYVPRSDDNCYIKRYHFLEGLSCYWQGLEIDYSTKVRKIAKRFTPFSYRAQACTAFSDLFKRFSKQKIVLSYSSNGYPDLDRLVEIMGETKRNVQVFKKEHRYHFGTHSRAKRSIVEEYLIVGQ